MKIVAIIPARMGSSRYPGKPLCDIHGMPMIEHVYRRTKMAGGIKNTYIATPDEVIKSATENFGGSVIMTGEHSRAIDRVAEAAKSIDADIIAIVQGDEPMIYPDMIDNAIASVVENSDIEVATMAKQIKNEAIFLDPNFAKIVVDTRMNALYFSREPIPSRFVQPFNKLPAYKHLAIIPITKKFLMKFAKMPETPLEKAESVDLNRAIEHGYTVRIVEVNRDVYQVDTKKDQAVVNELMKSDELLSKYK